MADIIVLTHPAPRRRAYSRASRVMQMIAAAGVFATSGFGLVLGALTLLYDGPEISFGPGGILLGSPPNLPGFVALSDFTRGQRLVGALALQALIAPVVFILAQLRVLFGMFARGARFAPDNARVLRKCALGFGLYALAPLVAHASIVLAGVANDPIWFHFDMLGALILAAFAFALAEIFEAAHQLETDNNGFI